MFGATRRAPTRFHVGEESAQHQQRQIRSETAGIAVAGLGQGPFSVQFRRSLRIRPLEQLRRSKIIRIRQTHIGARFPSCRPTTIQAAEPCGARGAGCHATHDPWPAISPNQTGRGGAESPVGLMTAATEAVGGCGERTGGVCRDEFLG